MEPWKLDPRYWALSERRKNGKPMYRCVVCCDGKSREKRHIKAHEASMMHHHALATFHPPNASPQLSGAHTAHVSTQRNPPSTQGEGRTMVDNALRALLGLASAIKPYPVERNAIAHSSPRSPATGIDRGVYAESGSNIVEASTSSNADAKTALDIPNDDLGTSTFSGTKGRETLTPSNQDRPGPSGSDGIGQKRAIEVPSMRPLAVSLRSADV